MKRVLAGIILAASLAACGNGGGDSGEVALYEAPPASAPAPMDMAANQQAMAAPRMMVVDEDQGGGGGGPSPAPVTDPAAARQIAYMYYYTLKSPTAQMEALFNAQKTACENAGPAVCFVTSSSLSGLAEGEYASGHLQMKASAAWIEAFRTGLPDSLKPYSASIDSSTSTAEDLTTQIVDTSARLNSSKTLRDRMQKLLAERPGKLADLIEIERELARVQAEIDSTESILAAMRLRVAMSDLQVNYEPKFSAASESIWRPLGDAFSDFLPNVAGSLAGIVRFISETLLWIVFLGGIIALVVWRWRKRGAKRRAAVVEPPKAPA
jgi:hypothetical protein